MATPLTADQMLAALRAEGLRVVEHDGWRTHNRGNRGDGWGPVHGVMIHHTGGTPPSDGQIVWSGRSDLPGPCAHAYLATDGTITLTGHGRANHAGGGDGAVLQAVIEESYATRPPAPHKHEGSPGAVDGNARFYGLECSNPGNANWPASQYDAAVRWAAAICRAHGWTAKSAIGHKEWSDWKPDPVFDMPGFRAAVAERLKHPASWSPGGGNTGTSKEDTDMQLTDADRKAIAKEVVAELLAAPLASPTAPKGTDPNRSFGTYVRWGDQHHKELKDGQAAILAAVNRLTAALTKEG